MAFTIPHYIAGIRMIVKTSSGIRKWEDLRDKTIVTTKGTTSVAELRKMNDVRVLNMKFIEAKDHAESFAMVEAGKADALSISHDWPGHIPCVFGTKRWANSANGSPMRHTRGASGSTL
ncbi:hypothetical protein R1479_04602 [Ralstonia mannitolilytica]|nr:hypothetical protein R1479_04602 [Ralstonia mannitolilytica]